MPTTLGAPPPRPPRRYPPLRTRYEATRDWVSAIANNTLEAIPTGIHNVHQARMATEKALEKGEYELTGP